MAKASLHALLKELRGNLDGFVVRKIRGKYFVSRKPELDRKHKPTANQQSHRKRFRAASAYAAAVQLNPTFHDFYAPIAKKRGLRVRALAISDWFNPPKVTSVDLSRYHGRAGDVINVRATDEYGVTNVTVGVQGADRQWVEHGEAVAKRNCWCYTATTNLPPRQPLTIVVRAYDRPSQVGEMKLPWPPAAEGPSAG